MNNPWKLYDDLIASVPEDSQVSACLAGLSWFLVRSQGVGVAMRPREMEGPVCGAGGFGGMKVKDLAARIKSWNNYEAAMGLAAINSALNAPDTVRRNCGSLLDETSDQDVFACLLEELRGKRVAVIGHFFNLERVAAVCDLSILERRPEARDLPDPACEYILPQQDVVIMSATTLINKTMPRLLELSCNARVVVAGPSTPLTPILLEHGVDILGGLMVEDEDRVWKTVSEGGQHEIFKSGSHMVKVSKMSLERRA
jgi:hypothetical protein